METDGSRASLAHGYRRGEARRNTVSRLGVLLL